MTTELLGVEANTPSTLSPRTDLVPTLRREGPLSGVWLSDSRRGYGGGGVLFWAVTSLPLTGATL